MTVAESKIVKPTPTELMEDAGTGLDYGTRPDRMLGDLSARFPLVSVVRTIECGGNRRVEFGAELRQTFDGTQWGRGAISTAELPWPARLRSGPQLIRGRAFAGEHRVTAVKYRIDDGGTVQPTSAPWNELGYMHGSVLAHPVVVSDEPV